MYGAAPFNMAPLGLTRLGAARCSHEICHKTDNLFVPNTIAICLPAASPNRCTGRQRARGPPSPSSRTEASSWRQPLHYSYRFYLAAVSRHGGRSLLQSPARLPGAARTAWQCNLHAARESEQCERDRQPDCCLGRWQGCAEAALQSICMFITCTGCERARVACHICIGALFTGSAGSAARWRRYDGVHKCIRGKNGQIVTHGSTHRMQRPENPPQRCAAVLAP